MKMVKFTEKNVLICFLLLAGLGREVFLTKLVGVGVGIVVLGLVYLDKKKLKLPELFLGYGLFLLIGLISLIWSQDKMASLEEWFLFTAGGLFWLISFNLKKDLSKCLDKLMVLLSLIFGGMFLYQYFFNEMVVRSWSLYLSYSGYDNHFMIGDFWSVMMGIAAINHWWWLWPLGVFLLVLSQSRAAVVGLAVGVWYWLKHKKRVRQYGWWLLLGLAVVFLTFGRLKPIFASRHYYIQSLIGLKYYPLGVGMGNFKIITEDQRTHLWGMSGYATNVHNIVLEIMSGLGWLGLVFLWWLYRLMVRVWQSRGNLKYRVGFVILTVNFLLFASYFAPAMLWLWFLLLGLIL